MDMTEKRVDGELKFDGRIFKVYLDTALLCDGTLASREVVINHGGVTVLPVDDEGNCYMVSQYRYPPQQMMLEAPAGKLELGEDHRECAVRELSEETGFTADELIYLGGFYSSPGFCSEKIHIYLALGLHAGKAHLDEGEYLNVEKISLKKLSEMAMNNEIVDAKTVIAVLKAEKYLSQR